LTITGALSGLSPGFFSLNTSDTAGSHARFYASVGGASAGNPYYVSAISGGGAWSWGADNANSDNWVLANSTGLGTGNVLVANSTQLLAANAGSAGTPAWSWSGDPNTGLFNSANAVKVATDGTQIAAFTTTSFDVSRSVSGGGAAIQLDNTSNTASSTARYSASVGGTSAGDPFFLFAIPSGLNWSIGSDNSDSDKFKISEATTLGTNDRLTIATGGLTTITGGTLATDGSENWFKVTGTFPDATDSISGVSFSFTTTAGASLQNHRAVSAVLGAGYVGSGVTSASSHFNLVAGTGTTLSLATAGIGAANYGSENQASASTAGVNVGGIGYATASTATNAGLYGKAVTTAAGSAIGVLGTAGSSTEGTDLKNVGIYGTLNSSLLTGVNASFAGLFDGGTLPDATSNILRALGTLPNLSGAVGSFFDTTTPTSSTANLGFYGIRSRLNAGYTGGDSGGVAFTIAMDGTNNAESAGANLQLNTNQVVGGNIGVIGVAQGATAGKNYGSRSDALNSTGMNVGHYARAVDDPAGTNIGVLANAANSTEGTDLKNVAGYFTLNSALVTGSNVSVALIAQNDDSADIFRGYDGTTQKFQMTQDGQFIASGTANIGWSIVLGANTACTTTCTNACVVGFATGTVASDAERPVACSDTTADRCLCAGSS
jgi:hypothetical protein